HADDLLYVHEWGKWLRWDDRRWAFERTLKVFDLARKLVREIANGIDNKLAARVQSASTVNAIVSLARSDRAHARVTEDFDADPWALNTPVATFDLRTQAKRAHCRRDGITKMTPVSPIDVTAPNWAACLATWTNSDNELIAFLQRLCGYWLTGSVREEKLAVIHGIGGHAKLGLGETVPRTTGRAYRDRASRAPLTVDPPGQQPPRPPPPPPPP